MHCYDFVVVALTLFSNERVHSVRVKVVRKQQFHENDQHRIETTPSSGTRRDNAKDTDLSTHQHKYPIGTKVLTTSEDDEAPSVYYNQFNRKTTKCMLSFVLHQIHPSKRKNPQGTLMQDLSLPFDLRVPSQSLKRCPIWQ